MRMICPTLGRASVLAQSAARFGTVYHNEFVGMKTPNYQMLIFIVGDGKRTAAIRPRGQGGCQYGRQCRYACVYGGLSRFAIR